MVVYDVGLHPRGGTMPRLLNDNKLYVFVAFATFLLATQSGMCQNSSASLLRLQRSKAFLDIDNSAPHARGLYGITYGNPGDVWRYPNSLSCLVVYGDGRYVLEKRDEPTLGKPKVKRAEGSLGADDLQRLKGILDDEALKKIKTPNMPGLPDDAQAVRDIA